MKKRYEPAVRRTWAKKFADAFSGLWYGIHGQSSFAVHVLVSFAVIGTGAFFKVNRIEWCLLVLCITLVLSVEMVNSALEWLAKAIDEAENDRLGRALDISSAAVLLAAIGTAVVGGVIFWPYLADMVNG